MCNYSFTPVCMCWMMSLTCHILYCIMFLNYIVQSNLTVPNKRLPYVHTNDTHWQTSDTLLTHLPSDKPVTRYWHTCPLTNQWHTINTPAQWQPVTHYICNWRIKIIITSTQTITHRHAIFLSRVLDRVPITTSKSRTQSYENRVDVVARGNFLSIFSLTLLCAGYGRRGCFTAAALRSYVQQW